MLPFTQENYSINKLINKYAASLTPPMVDPKLRPWLLLVEVSFAHASLNRPVLLKMPSNETPKMSISPSHMQINI